MRAWQVVEHGEPQAVMKLGEKAVPDPGPGEVRILVKALALGLPDVFMCRGTYAFNPAIPFTPGQEVVGIVTAAGEGVDLAIDSRVIATTSKDGLITVIRAYVTNEIDRKFSFVAKIEEFFAAGSEPKSH